MRIKIRVNPVNQCQKKWGVTEQEKESKEFANSIRKSRDLMKKLNRTQSKRS